MGGAPNASEVPYVFNLPESRQPAIDTGQDEAVAALTHEYWVNFAKFGSPEGEGLLAWPKATPGTTRVQWIGTNETKHIDDPRTVTLDFRERLAEDG